MEGQIYVSSALGLERLAPDATKERIAFAPGILTRTMRGSNKPTFQQAHGRNA